MTLEHGDHCTMCAQLKAPCQAVLLYRSGTIQERNNLQRVERSTEQITWGVTIHPQGIYPTTTGLGETNH